MKNKLILVALSAIASVAETRATIIRDPTGSGVIYDYEVFQWMAMN